MPVLFVESVATNWWYVISVCVCVCVYVGSVEVLVLALSLTVTSTVDRDHSVSFMAKGKTNNSHERRCTEAHVTVLTNENCQLPLTALCWRAVPSLYAICQNVLTCKHLATSYRSCAYGTQETEQLALVYLWLPTIPEWPGQSRNWPLPSCFLDWLDFVPESCATANWHCSQVHSW